MRKIILLCLLGLMLNPLVKAQICTADSTLKTPGIKPSVLPDAIVGQPYSAVVSLIVPKDTSIKKVILGTLQTVDITIDSAQAIYINNFPDTSFKYECNMPNCTWLGGDKGCAKLTGMPKLTHNKKYTITIYVKSWVRAKILPTQQFEQIDSNTIDLNLVGFTGMDEQSTKLNYTVYPNPVSGKAYIYGTEINPKNNYEISIAELTGKTIQAYTHKAFGDVIEIDVTNIAKGVYLLKLADGEKYAYQKLIVE